MELIIFGITGVFPKDPYSLHSGLSDTPYEYPVISADSLMETNLVHVLPQSEDPSVSNPMATKRSDR